MCLSVQSVFVSDVTIVLYLSSVKPPLPLKTFAKLSCAVCCLVSLLLNKLGQAHQNITVFILLYYLNDTYIYIYISSYWGSLPYRYLSTIHRYDCPWIWIIETIICLSIVSDRRCMFSIYSCAHFVNEIVT